MQSLSLDLNTLASSLTSAPSVTQGVRDQLRQLLTPPQTLEDLEQLIARLEEQRRNPGSVRTQASVSMNVERMEQQIQRAKFFMTGSDDEDYI